MNEQLIEVSSGGIKCDNPNCNYFDDSVTVEQYQDFLNKPCPECGENLLTEEDLNNTNIILEAAKALNKLSKDDLKAIAKLFGQEIEEDESTKKAVVVFDTHKNVSISEIKVSEE